MQHPSRTRCLAVLCALLPSACAVEAIDAIIAEHSVTCCSSESGDTADTSTSSSSSSSTTSTDTTDSSTASSDPHTPSGDPDSGGHDGSSGPPPAPVCGDGIVDPDEECDDADQLDGNDCRNDCTRRWFVFVTSEPLKQGQLNGISGADYECRHRATKAYLINAERYMAWISTADVQPAERMYHARGPYVLLNGKQIAADWDALTSGSLEHPINRTENGDTVDVAVWTGTDITGERMPNTQHCSDWTYNDSDQTAWIADATATDILWTRGVESYCGGLAAIYCFEQP